VGFSFHVVAIFVAPPQELKHIFKHHVEQKGRKCRDGREGVGVHTVWLVRHECPCLQTLSVGVAEMEEREKVDFGVREAEVL
jgi:hypothetical protein